MAEGLPHIHPSVRKNRYHTRSVSSPVGEVGDQASMKATYTLAVSSRFCGAERRLKGFFANLYSRGTHPAGVRAIAAVRSNRIR